MKKFLQLIICGLLLIFCMPPAFSSSIADISTVGVGARSLGVGRAFSALSDDPSAMFINPSGIGQIRSLAFTSMRGNLAQDISYSVLGVVLPIRLGTMGLGIIDSSVTEIPLTRWQTAGGVTRPITYDLTDYSSRAIFLSYGVNAGELFKKEKLNGLYLGASLKYFYQGFSGSAASLEGAVGSGIDLDMGFKIIANNWLNLGASFSNMLPDDLGGRFNWQRNGYSENIPSRLKAGVAVQFLGDDGLRQYRNIEGVWLFDIEKEIDKSKDPVLLHTGLEISPVKFLFLRAGLDQQPSATVGGVGVDTNLSCGIGIKAASFSFDYAYHRYGDVSENATHYFSIGYSGPEIFSGKNFKPSPFAGVISK